MNQNKYVKSSRYQTLLSLPVFFAITAIASVSNAQTVLFDSSAQLASFGNAGTIDTTTWSPNSDVEQSVRFTWSGWNGGVLFPGSSVKQIAPATIDPSAMTMSFDYMTTETTSLGRLTAYVFTGTDTIMFDASGAFPLINDGEWHTYEYPFSSFTAEYNTAVAAEAFDPDVAQTIRFRFQRNGNIAGTNETIYFDNVVLVPEPSTYAAILGLMVLVVMIRRRMS